MSQLLERVRQVARLRHLSLRTEHSYLDWIRRYIRFHQLRHPLEMGAQEIRLFLSHLAIERQVAAATQNQAFAALLFLYRDVLHMDLPRIEGVERAKRAARLPVVLTSAEVKSVLAHLDGVNHLVASLLYGAGLRLMDALRLRVKDIDFQMRQLTIREGKGDKDRITMVPDSLTEPLQHHLARRLTQHEIDLKAHRGEVYLPHALAVKYPQSGSAWAWQYVFAAPNFSTDPRSGITRRHHLAAQSVQRAVKRAVEKSGISKLESPLRVREILA